MEKKIFLKLIQKNLMFILFTSWALYSFLYMPNVWAYFKKENNEIFFIIGHAFLFWATFGFSIDNS